MKIKLLSDLHLEGRQGYVNRNQPWSRYGGEDVLVLAGDVAVGVDNVEDALMYFISRGFKEIVYTLGNHEGYHGTFVNFVKELRHRFNKETNAKVHILDCDGIVKIGDVSFFGGTLWTNFGNKPEAVHMAANYINDFRVIKGWTHLNAVSEFKRQSEFIKWAYENTPGKKVIVTHFLPTQLCVAERYRSNQIEMLLNYYFANNLSSWIETLENTTWLYGHTHDCQDHLEGTTRLISNPLGYAREDIPDIAKHNPNLVIEL